jgi:oligoribonuclease
MQRLDKNLGFIWLDLETTGLEPSEGLILEVALQLAEPRDALKMVGELESTCIRGGYLKDRTPYELADDYVRKMHTDSGLWDACREPDAVTIEAVDDMLGDLFARSEAERIAGMRYRLAGSSVHFDLGWVQKHLPKFARNLSHQVYDVSTLILEAEMLGYSAPSETLPAHRAAPDIQWSQDQARRLREFSQKVAA